jgi:membrane protein involved in colicin uptake
MSDVESDYEEAAPAPKTPTMNVPKLTIPDGEAIDFNDINRERQQKDLIQLQRLIDAHFEQRKKDEEELESLRLRIEERKAKRAVEMQERQEKEKEKVAREREERKQKEAEEEEKRKAEEDKKKQAIANMSLHYGGYLRRAEKNKPNKRQTEREKKKKILAERRKPLNIDHLSVEKLREKVTEFWTDLYGLEEEKYDMEQRISRQKYDINQLRQRVSEYMGKFSKNKRTIKVGTSVGAAKSAVS